MGRVEARAREMVQILKKTAILGSGLRSKGSRCHWNARDLRDGGRQICLCSGIITKGLRQQSCQKRSSGSYCFWKHEDGWFEGLEI